MKKIYLTNEVVNQIDKLPKSLSLQILYQFKLCEKNNYILNKTFKNISLENLNNSKPLRQLNFNFAGKQHRMLAYQNKDNKMGILTYDTFNVQEKISVEKINELREKAYYFNNILKKESQPKRPKIKF